MATTGEEIKNTQLVRIKTEMDSMMPQMQAALGNSLITAEQINRTAMTILADADDRILNAPPRQIVRCIIEAAQLGLTFDKSLGQAYLVVYDGKVQLQPGYRGLIKLAYNSSIVDGIEAHNVFEGDEFDYMQGTDQFIHHKPLFKSRGDANLLFSYAIIHYRKSDRPHIEIMPKEDILAVRAGSMAWSRSKNPQYTPWGQHFGEMARKTVLRRALKYAPLSSVDKNLIRAMQLDDQVESGVPQDLVPEITDPPGTVTVMPNDEKAPTSTKLYETLRKSSRGKKKQEPVIDVVPQDAPPETTPEVQEAYMEGGAAEAAQVIDQPAAEEPVVAATQDVEPQEETVKVLEPGEKAELHSLLRGNVEMLQKLSQASMGFVRNDFDAVFPHEAKFMLNYLRKQSSAAV